MSSQPPKKPDHKTKPSKVDRRRFMASGLRAAAGAGIVGLALVAGAKRTTATTPPAIRPPGALQENTFSSACVRCGLCVRDCPYDILDLADYGSKLPTGTPYFVARDKPCEMCEDIPCVKACPSGALSKTLTSIDDARMGLAVLTSQETCLNFLGLRCDVCYRVCPLINKAITLEMERNLRTGRHARFLPTVHSDYCTGCGKCEHACVLEKAAIKVLPIDLAKGKIDDHYRVGWDEKNTISGQKP